MRKYEILYKSNVKGIKISEYINSSNNVTVDVLINN